MKKIVTFSLFVSLFFTSTFAQESGDFRFGIQASPMVSWMSNNADGTMIEGDGTNFAFKLGGLAEYYFADKYAFRTGINMTFNQGGTLKINDAQTADLFTGTNADPTFTDGSTVTYSLQYLEIPFGLKITTEEIGSITYFFEVPVATLGFNVAARGTINDGEDFNLSDDIRLLQISWGLGGGLQYRLTENAAVMGGLFFQSGLLNVNDTDNGTLNTTKTIVNAMTLRIGIMF